MKTHIHDPRLLLQESVDSFAAFLSRLSLVWPYCHASDEHAMRDAAWWHSMAMSIPDADESLRRAASACDVCWPADCTPEAHGN